MSRNKSHAHGPAWTENAPESDDQQKGTSHGTNWPKTFMWSFFFPTWVWGRRRGRGGRDVFKLLAIGNESDPHSDSTKWTIWIKLSDGDYIKRKSIWSKYINRELMERAFMECLAANSQNRAKYKRALYSLFLLCIFQVTLAYKNQVVFLLLCFL